MPVKTPVPTRRDGIANRERLIEAARSAFAMSGLGVALEDIAAAAGVSRMTLYRNFRNREELAVVIFSENVERIERRARELMSDPRGIVVLVDEILQQQETDLSLRHLLRAQDLSWYSELSLQTEHSLQPLLDAGITAGLVHPDVTAADLMLGFSMAGGALAEDSAAGRGSSLRRIRKILHRSFFTGS